MDTTNIMDTISIVSLALAVVFAFTHYDIAEASDGMEIVRNKWGFILMYLVPLIFNSGLLVLNFINHWYTQVQMIAAWVTFAIFMIDFIIVVIAMIALEFNERKHKKGDDE